MIDLDEQRAAVELDAAQEAMRTAVKAARADGQAIPCMSSGADWWLSERADERARAARKCAGCPVLGACERLACGAEFGVWAGKDRTPLPVNPEARLHSLTAAGDLDGRNDLILALREHNPQVWTHRALAAASGLDKASVHRLITTGSTVSFRTPTAAIKQAQIRRRLERIRVEVDAVDHPIVNQLRQLGRVEKRSAAQAMRDELLLELARSSSWWTYERLAAAASMTPTGALKAVQATTARDRRQAEPTGKVGDGRTPRRAGAA
jgi:hypothetical protein